MAHQPVRKLSDIDFMMMDLPTEQVDVVTSAEVPAEIGTYQQTPEASPAAGGENVIKLVAPRPPSPVDPHVISELENLLERAKAGRFNGIAYVTVTSDAAGNYSALGTAWAGAGIEMNAHTAVGGIEVLKHRALMELFEWERDEDPHPTHA